MHLVGWFIWSYQLHSVLSTGTCKKYVPYCHHDIMVGWINATTVESQCPWTPIFGVSTFCDHLLQYHCFDIFVTGLDEFRWDHVVGDLTIFWGFQPFVITNCSRLHLKCDGTRAETRFRLSAKRTSLFKSAGGASSVLLAAEVCASAVVMLDTPCSEVVWRVLATLLCLRILILCLCMATLTEVLPCFFLSCRANARVKPAKTGHGPHSS